MFNYPTFRSFSWLGNGYCSEEPWCRYNRKTITLDRTIRSYEHIMSLEFEDMENL